MQGDRGPAASRVAEAVAPSRVAVDAELDVHEALLRTGAPAVRVAVIASPAVSFGVGVPPDAGYLVRAHDAGVATVRRSTGGSGILHLEGDLLWAVVLPRADLRVGRDFARAYGRLGEGLVRALAAEKLASRWTAAPGLAEEYCPLSSRGEVLEIDGRIVGGAAQHASAQALLHHGTLSMSIDRAAVDRLFDLEAPSPSHRLGEAGLLRDAPGAEAMAIRLAKTLGLATDG